MYLKKDIIKIGLLGAGNFAMGVLLPIISSHKDKFYLKTIVNRSGDKALNAANLFHAEKIASDDSEIFDDPDIDLVLICTRHNNHAELVLKGLRAGKNVYVEKPLAVSTNQLEEVKAYFNEYGKETVPILMVGFNRRFSPYIREIKRVIDNRTSPVIIRYRMNAGFAPTEAWVHEDGGRIIGEGCHLIDLMQYLVGQDVVSCSSSHISPKQGRFLSEDNRSIAMEFGDGSLAIIDYLSCVSSELPKEYLEVHWENKSVIMDDYKKLTGYGIKVKNVKSSTPLKGHEEEWMALYTSLIKGQFPIELNSIFLTTELSILAAQE